MAKDKTTVRFWLRTDRPNKDGSSPIHSVYQIKGDRKYYVIPGIKLCSVNWDIDNQVAVYLDKKSAKQKDPNFNPETLLTNAEVNEINSKLQEFAKDIADIEHRFKLDDKLKLEKKGFDVQMVINKLIENKLPETRKVQPGNSIVDFITLFNKETTAHKERTIIVFEGLKNHIIRYEQAKKTRLTFEDIDVQTIKSFQNFLLEKYDVNTKHGTKRTFQMNNVTVSKVLNTFKTILRKAENEYDRNVNQKYKKYKNPHPRKDSDFEVVSLTNEELQAILDLDLSENKRLDEARDIYLFSIASGFRYGDLAQFDRQHIKKDNVIRMPSSDKNSKLIEVPLNPISFAIIQKYSDRLRPLPVTAKGTILSNQKLNDYIKEVCELAGIDSPIEQVREIGTKKVTETFKKYELLSIHTGRKTFTTLSLGKGYTTTGRNEHDYPHFI